jgi:hypothetical protein
MPAGCAEQLSAENERFDGSRIGIGDRSFEISERVAGPSLVVEPDGVRIERTRES